MNEDYKICKRLTPSGLSVAGYVVVTLSEDRAPCFLGETADASATLFRTKREASAAIAKMRAERGEL
jgi:hypothetical protein